MYEKLKKIWNWVKDHIVAIGIAVIGILTLGRYASSRRDDKRTASEHYSDRERESERLNQRIERTTEIQSEFIGDCKDRLEEVEQHLGTAEDTTDRLEQSNVTAEQAIAELRRRLAEGKDEK